MIGVWIPYLSSHQDEQNERCADCRRTFELPHPRHPFSELSWVFHLNSLEKCFIVILIEFSIIKQNLTIEELAEVAGAFRKQCQSIDGVSDDLIDGINMGEFPKDHNLMVNGNSICFH